MYVQFELGGAGEGPHVHSLCTGFKEAIGQGGTGGSGGVYIVDDGDPLLCYGSGHRERVAHIAVSIARAQCRLLIIGHHSLNDGIERRKLQRTT